MWVLMNTSPKTRAEKIIEKFIIPCSLQSLHFFQLELWSMATIKKVHWMFKTLIFPLLQEIDCSKCVRKRKNKIIKFDHFSINNWKLHFPWPVHVFPSEVPRGPLRFQRQRISSLATNERKRLSLQPFLLHFSLPPQGKDEYWRKDYSKSSLKEVSGVLETAILSKTNLTIG